MSKLIVNEIEKYDAGQLTITTGTDVSIGSDLTVGGSIAGTLSTAAQTNITSVGTLSSLTVASSSAAIATFTSTAVASALSIDNTNANLWGSNISFKTNTVDKGFIGTIGSLIGNTDQDLTMYATSGVGVRFYTNGNNERMRIDTSGNVGIGTSSPSKKLDVFTNVNASNEYQLSLRNGSGGTGVSTGIAFGFNSAAADPDYLANIFSVITNRTTRSADIIFSTASAATPTERMRITSAGNVGIGVNGVTGANVKLEIAQTTDNTDGPSLRISNLGNTLSNGQLIGALEFYNGDDSGAGNNVGCSIKSICADAVNPANSDLLVFSTGGNSERMRIDSSGRVGIGVSSPTAALHINQGSTLKIRSNNETTNYAYMSFANTGGNFSFGVDRSTGGGLMNGTSAYATVLGTNNATDLSFGTNLYERMRITSGGAVFMPYLTGSSGYNDLAYNTANGQLIYRTSSLRYKENVQDLPSALNKVNNLRTVTYDEKETGRSYFGLIAEELYEHIPELVTMKDIEGFDEPQPDGITYSMLSVYLLKAMQEQQEIINDLKSRIETLENN